MDLILSHNSIFTVVHNANNFDNFKIAIHLPEHIKYKNIYIILTSINIKSSNSSHGLMLELPVIHNFDTF